MKSTLVIFFFCIETGYNRNMEFEDNKSTTAGCSVATSTEFQVDLPIRDFL